MTVLILAALLAQTSTPASDKNWKQVCSAALEKPFVTPVPVPEDLKGCDEQQAYYGFSEPANRQEALRCGLYQRAHPNPSQGDPYYGPGILSMIYANGSGVPRDYDTAIRLACENTWAAPAENEMRIGHLERLRETGADSTDFDLCDDATSGLMAAACASVTERRNETKRKQELQAIVNQWPIAVQLAFPVLQGAEDKFIDTRTGGEVDLSGTARGAFSLEEEGRLGDQFLSNLRRFATGDIPPADTVLEKQVNDLYQRALVLPVSGTVTAEGVRRTQIAWIALRDQWMAFAQIAWPNATAARIVSELQRQRIQELEALDARR